MQIKDITSQATCYVSPVKLDGSPYILIEPSPVIVPGTHNATAGRIPANSPL
jgi:hypothetical protein